MYVSAGGQNPSTVLEVLKSQYCRQSETMILKKCLFSVGKDFGRKMLAINN